jgi:hypothetical protein
MTGENLAREAIAQIPRLLSALDRNPHSATFGCFDRVYWHTDRLLAPDAGLQVGAWTLALAQTTRAPFNPFFNQPNLADWAMAALRYTASLSSCRLSGRGPSGTAQGWTEAITLFSACETCRLLKELPADIASWIERQARSLAARKPNTGHSHVEAWTLLALHLAGTLLKISDWNLTCDHRLDRLLERQDSEGWFPEHGGADPGLLTLTLSALTRHGEECPSPRTQVALEKALLFLSQTAHPDGSFGGELYESGTHTWFPDGLQSLGKTAPQAFDLQDHLFQGLRRGVGAAAADLGWIALHSACCLMVWRSGLPLRPLQNFKPELGSFTFPHAELRVERGPDWTMFISLGRGGIFKLFRQQNMVAADTHFSVKVREGNRLRQASGNVSGFSSWEQVGDTLKITGQLAWEPSRPCIIGRLLRALGWSGCRCQCSCARPAVAPFAFTRTFTERNGEWIISDELQADDWSAVESAGIAGDQTWKRHPACRLYQDSQLQPWFDITHEIRKLSHGERFKLDRSL